MFVPSLSFKAFASAKGNSLAVVAIYSVNGGNDNDQNERTVLCSDDVRICPLSSRRVGSYATDLVVRACVRACVRAVCKPKCPGRRSIVFEMRRWLVVVA